MAAKYYAMRSVGPWRKGDEIPPDYYKPDHIGRMISMNMIRRENAAEAQPKPAPAKRPAKKAASKKSASAKK